MKYALVTGASRGIGKAISLKLAANGCFVLVNYRSNDEEAEKTLKEIKEIGGDGALLKFDVGNKEEVEKVLGTWVEEHKDQPIDILVNNAGIRKDQLIMWMKQEEWEGVLNTNLNSFYYITRLVLKGMIAKRWGRVVNIVSLSGVKGLPGQVNYSAAKAGLIGATKALAQEIGRRNITVNAVAPGFVKTDMTEDFNEDDYKAIIPLRRFGEPEEIASLVNFLASDDASYITGEVVNINGGLHT